MLWRGHLYGIIKSNKKDKVAVYFWLFNRECKGPGLWGPGHFSHTHIFHVPPPPPRPPMIYTLDLEAAALSNDLYPASNITLSWPLVFRLEWLESSTQFINLNKDFFQDKHFHFTWFPSRQHLFHFWKTPGQAAEHWTGLCTKSKVRERRTLLTDWSWLLWLPLSPFPFDLAREWAHGGTAFWNSHNLLSSSLHHIWKDILLDAMQHWRSLSFIY